MLQKFWKVSLFSVIAVLFLAACGGGDNKAKDNTDKKDETTTEKSGEKLQLIATFSIINEILLEVGGDLVEVHSMVPIGQDPHEYDPLPEDIKKATDSDAMFFNGLNLEGGEKGWFTKLVKNVHKEDSQVFEVMKGVEPMYLAAHDGKEEQMNPHAFLSPLVGIKMVENVRDALSELSPENKATFEANAEEFLSKLRDIDKMYEEKIADIDEDKRVLVTSEHAYQYMAEHYGLKEGYIWEIDTEENGTPEQIKHLVKFVKDTKVPVLFVETNVDKRPMETVSKETGVEIFAEIYSDELGAGGTDGETYLKFLTSNIEKIHDGLTSK